MALTNTWVAIAAVAAVIAVIVAALVWRGRAATGSGSLVARAERLRQLPAVRRAAQIRVVALIGAATLGAISVVAAGVAAARPMAAQVIEPSAHSRDIMLCLDVSGSMTDVDIEILEVFDALADGFDGERIGLTIFNSSPVQVFPLTDDYPFIHDAIESLRTGMEEGTASGGIPEHWAGTLDGPGSSLIGDGLAACTLRFDHADTDRSRSIILATDNEDFGESIVTLDEAAAHSAEKGIRVFALNPVQDSASEPSERLSRAASATGGHAYALRGETTVADIIAEVEREEATALDARPEVVVSDAPEPWILIAIIASVATVVIAGRIRA